MPEHRIVITGISLATPVGQDVATAYGAWLRGEASFSEPKSIDLHDSVSRYAGLCIDPDLSKLPNRKVSKILRRKDILGVISAHEAMRHANLTNSHYQSERAGIFVGASSTQVGDSASYYPLVKACLDVPTGQFDSEMFGLRMHELVNPLVVLQILMNNALCYSSIDLGFRGVNNNIMDFHGSGLRALEDAFHAIQCERADVAVVMGLAGQVEPFHLAEGWQAGLLAETRDMSLEEAQNCVRPFSAQARGTIMSEGACSFILERADKALERGAKIWGEVLGAATCHDGRALQDIRRHQGQPCVSPGLMASLAEVSRQSGTPWTDVGQLITDADGSALTDSVLAASYQSLLSNTRRCPDLLTYKNVFGDLCEASGLIGAALALAAFQEGRVPATPPYPLRSEALGLPIPVGHSIEASTVIGVVARQVFGSSTAVLLKAWST